MEKYVLADRTVSSSNPLFETLAEWNDQLKQIGFDNSQGEDEAEFDKEAEEVMR